MEKDTFSNLTLFIEQMNRVYGECKVYNSFKYWQLGSIRS